MAKIDDLSGIEKNILRFLFNNIGNSKKYKEYFSDTERFSTLARLKKEGYITYLNLMDKGSVGTILLANHVVKYFEDNYE